VHRDFPLDCPHLLRPFFLRVVKVGDVEFVSALQELDKRDAEEFGCLASGDGAAPVQLHDH
jgi:hypothetical protein